MKALIFFLVALTLACGMAPRPQKMSVSAYGDDQLGNDDLQGKWPEETTLFECYSQWQGWVGAPVTEPTLPITFSVSDLRVHVRSDRIYQIFAIFVDTGSLRDIGVLGKFFDTKCHLFSARTPRACHNPVFLEKIPVFEFQVLKKRNYLDF